VPGLAAPLRTYIKALIASWLVWPRCITVAIPGTGYTLPSEDEKEKPATGLLHIQARGLLRTSTRPTSNFLLLLLLRASD